MTTINRKAGALWSGDSRSGLGTISTESQSLAQLPYNYQTRFGEQAGTNPEELIAAAHAACFSMALASTLKKNGFDPKHTDTNATCTVVSKNGGYEITRMQLHVRADVPNLNNATFQKLVKEADEGCPVSNLLRNQLDIKIDAMLI
ncbi:MAG: OsmC family protein [Chloroflexi bacterium]|nr:OsmC family protein [Chloroflexota bacterium]